jgi:hypothetical protein
MRRSWYALLAPVLAGAVAGAVVAFAISPLGKRRQAPAPEREAASYAIDAEARQDNRRAVMTAGMAIADLRTRLAAVERQGPSQPDPPAQRLASPEERRAKVEAAQEDALRRHSAETIDMAWAPEASRIVTTTLAQLAAGGAFTVGGVDCRDTSCTADLTWPTLDAARETYRDLLHGDYGRVNCTRSILIPDQTDSFKPVKATLILNGCPK